MAGLIAEAVCASNALVAATAETLLQLVAAANHRDKLLGWGVFFDGVSPTGVPVLVELMRQTDAGTSSANTPRLVAPSGAAETIQTTARDSFTVEPTPSDILERRLVHPQQGFEIIYPQGGEPTIPGGGRIGIRCTAPAGVNAVAKMKFEE
jgi:hypothetical protein